MMAMISRCIGAIGVMLLMFHWAIPVWRAPSTEEAARWRYDGTISWTFTRSPMWHQPSAPYDVAWVHNLLVSVVIVGVFAFAVIVFGRHEDK